MDDAGTFANSKGGITVEDSYQVFYNQLNFREVFSERISILGIGLRIDESTPSIDVVAAKIQIWASTFTNSPSTLSAQRNRNWGSDRTLVFSGENIRFKASRDLGNARNFQLQLPFQTSFLYDRARGHLLLDVDTTGPYVGKDGYTDADSRGNAMVLKVRRSGFDNIIVPVGEVLQVSYVSIPSLQATLVTLRDLVLSFLAVEGETYLLEYKDGFASEKLWTTFTNIPAGVGREVSLRAAATKERQFFRVRIPDKPQFQTE